MTSHYLRKANRYKQKSIVRGVNPGISDEARYMCARCFRQKTEELGTTGADSHD